ncbi:MAG: poly-gamma-glutamate hydrolase family protein [Acidimicrobiales bacterium]
MDNSGGMTFAEVLGQPGVTEHHELRGPFGFLAYHGGPVERVTSMIAVAAAALANASVYHIDQPEERPLHIPSTRVTPRESSVLARIFDHVHTVCTVHGYGRDMDKQHVLIGGGNRELAEHVGQHLRRRLDDRFPVITDLKKIPRELRGVHHRNPANLSTSGGIQVELPPALRWNFEAGSWADSPGLEPTEPVRATIEGLATAAQTWA